MPPYIIKNTCEAIFETHAPWLSGSSYSVLEVGSEFKLLTWNELLMDRIHIDAGTEFWREIDAVDSEIGVCNLIV